MDNARRSRRSQGYSDSGIRSGELWKVSKLMSHLGIGDKLMKTWQEAGLKTQDLGSDSPFLLTDDLFAFYRKHPKLAKLLGR